MGSPATAVPSGSSRAAVRRAAALLALVAVLVSALAGALSATSGTSRLDIGPASFALTVALTLVGLLVGVAAALLLWSSLVRSRILFDASGARGGRFWRSMLAAVILGAFFGLVVLLRRGHARATAALLGHPAGAPARRAASAVHFVPWASGATFGAVAAVVLAVLLVHLLRWRRLKGGFGLHRLQGPPQTAVQGGVSEPLATSLAGVRVADPEEEPDPRAAVVAAYLAMTRAAARAGAERRRCETPSEFLGRLLCALGTSGGAAGRLTSLFETARYSSRPFGEASRLAAIEALGQVRADLAGLAPAGQP